MANPSSRGKMADCFFWKVVSFLFLNPPPSSSLSYPRHAPAALVRRVCSAPDTWCKCRGCSPFSDELSCTDAMHTHIHHEFFLLGILMVRQCQNWHLSSWIQNFTDVSPLQPAEQEKSAQLWKYLLKSVFPRTPRMFNVYPGNFRRISCIIFSFSNTNHMLFI